MNIHTETHGEVHVVRPAGRIDSTNASALEQALTGVFDGGGHWLLLDFSQLDYISSAGLRSVLLAGKKARAQPGGKLVLAGLREPIREIFELSGFLAIFTVCADLQAGLAEFGAAH